MSNSQPISQFSSGWIKLDRGIREHWLWADPVKLRWWLDILLSVNYTDKQVLLGNTLVDCRRGQVIFSIGTWSKRWLVHESQIRRFFELLKTGGLIVTESVGKSTRLTVCGYDTYTSDRRDDVNNLQGSCKDFDELPATTKKGNKIKNEKKREVFTPPTEEEVFQVFKSKGLDDPQSRNEASNFVNYYTSKGWLVGKTPMRNWQSSAALWVNRIRSSKKNSHAAQIRISAPATERGLFA